MEEIESRQCKLGTGSVYDRLMELCMRDPTFKTQLFRLVDVLPALRDRNDVTAHFREYLAEASERLPAVLRLAVTSGAQLPWLLSPVLRQNVVSMARQFMIHDRPEEVAKTLRQRTERGLSYTVDLLGEKVLSEQEANHYARRVQDMLTLLAATSTTVPRAWPAVNVSIKISALDPNILPTDPEGAIARLKGRLRPIFRQARALGAFIHFDMEDHQLKDLTLRLFCSLLEEEEFRDFRDAGIALQAYLRDAESDLRSLIDWAKRGERQVTVRLVKGAYWDYETVLARQKSWPVPVFQRKPESDLNFERLTALLLENAAYTAPALASHNVRSVAHALVQAERMKLGPDDFEFQMLYGMADSLKEALMGMGFRIREYCPVGELIPGMAYLVRRLLENSSNEGFLASRFSRRASTFELLRHPEELLPKRDVIEEPPQPGNDFLNTPPTDFTREEERQAFQAALEQVRAGLGRHWPMVIGGENVDGGGKLVSRNPAKVESVVGTVPMARKEHARRAVDAALAAAAAWAGTPAEERARVLDAVAEVLDRRRHEFSALEVLEVGKPWIEADADICEAIDFCRFYAVSARQLARPQTTQKVPGEDNFQLWRPRGVVAVIAPWNFPLAILGGMVTAALVTGNTVVMKPAEQSPVIAAWFMEVLREAGVPPGVVNLVTGLGDEVGEELVRHPAVGVVAFTGSREVGLKIWAAVGQTHRSQRHLKRAICEMGGKNALIVDEDADLDEAVQGALYSAFGYQGQKCSALSRLLVLEKVYERFLERFVEAAASLRVGDPADPGVSLGPLIDEQAMRKTLDLIASGKREGRIRFAGDRPNLPGYFIPPVIFAEVRNGARILREEIFAPIVAVTRVATLEEAIEQANSTEYGLTGGVYSRSLSRIEQVRVHLQVGNLYINRPITGAIVGRQPFGGYKMSGGGTKAGGREYLLQFMVPQVVSENTMRHGFAPDV